MPDAARPARGAGGRSFLAFDYGTRRTGVASGNTLLAHARPLTTLAGSADARLAAIATLVREWQPDALVVGVPRHPDGRPHDNTARAQRFARQLQGRFGLPVHEVDERYTTVEVIAAGAPDLDAAAAALILEQFLREQASRSEATPAVAGGADR
ncbi:MAG: Holliday junction resolvase RuvX [Burkholderiales bacterium]|nr:Holliday junction resolvase RuvX [Burkholderiales bacterium]